MGDLNLLQVIGMSKCEMTQYAIFFVLCQFVTGRCHKINRLLSYI